MSFTIALKAKFCLYYHIYAQAQSCLLHSSHLSSLSLFLSIYLCRNRSLCKLSSYCSLLVSFSVLPTVPSFVYGVELTSLLDGTQLLHVCTILQTDGLSDNISAIQLHIHVFLCGCILNKINKSLNLFPFKLCKMYCICSCMNPTGALTQNRKRKYLFDSRWKGKVFTQTKRVNEHKNAK